MAQRFSSGPITLRVEAHTLRLTGPETDSNSRNPCCHNPESVGLARFNKCLAGV
jgi:hypothetical protein